VQSELEVESAGENQRDAEHANAIHAVKKLAVSHQKLRSRLDVVWWKNMPMLSAVLKARHAKPAIRRPRITHTNVTK